MSQVANRRLHQHTGYIDLDTHTSTKVPLDFHTSPHIVSTVIKELK